MVHDPQWTDLVALQALDCEHGGQMASCELDLFCCDASLLPSCVSFQLCVGNKLVCGNCPVLLALTCTPKLRRNGQLVGERKQENAGEDGRGRGRL
jgi:hypothetical protein